MFRRFRGLSLDRSPNTHHVTRSERRKRVRKKVWMLQHGERKKKGKPHTDHLSARGHLRLREFSQRAVSAHPSDAPTSLSLRRHRRSKELLPKGKGGNKPILSIFSIIVLFTSLHTHMPSLSDVAEALSWQQPPSRFTRRYCLLCVFLFCLINLLDQADRWAVPTLQVV